MPLARDVKRSRGTQLSRAIAVLAAVSVYVLLYSFAWPTAPLSGGLDTREYLDYAARLTSGGFNEPHNRLPGYPLILALFGGPNALQNRYLFYFQLVTHALGSGLLAAVLSRLGVSRALCTLFMLVMLLPQFVDSAAFILTESVTGVILAALLYALVCWILGGNVAHAWLASFLAAAAFLLRPAYLLLAPCLAVALYFTRPRRLSFRFVMAFAAPSALACAVLIAVNQRAFAYVGLTPKAGFMLFTRTLTFLERIPDSHSDVREVLIRNRDRSLTVRGSSHTATQFMWEGGLAELLRTTGQSKPELSNDMLRLNVGLIAKEPLQYSAVVIRSIGDMWLPSASRVSFFDRRVLQLVWALLHMALVSLYCVALAFGIARLAIGSAGRSNLLQSPSLNRNSGTVELLLHVAVWYTCFVSAALEVGDPRYLKPVLPLAAAAAVLFLVRWNDLRVNRLHSS